MNKIPKIVELFAGVGGFRVGFNQIEHFDKQGRAIEKNDWDFVWANQWEPGTKVQHAFEIYSKRFGVSPHHVNEDIFKIDKNTIPDHDVLVGGFPCQDYSVARSLSGEKGIEGKKGVLWWEIYKTIIAKKPKFILLENVDRLLKSPSKKRGRDFGIMLASLQEQGYIVEWRIINAAEYGFPQKRKRVFIFATLESIGKNIYNADSNQIAQEKGFFSKEFPISEEISEFKQIELKYKDLIEVTNNFSFDFENYGYLINKTIYTTKVKSAFDGVIQTLGDVLDSSTEKTPYLINNIEKWEYLKSAKKIARTSKTGFTYNFSEGPVAFPDKLDKPARTMLTSESSLNRSSHVIYESKLKAYRTLTPLEAERLNGFPDNWTEGISDKRRYFMMGNALVCGVVNKLSKSLFNFFEISSSK